MHNITIIYFLIHNSSWEKTLNKMFKRGQYQLSTPPIKALISSSSEPQTFSAIKLTTTSVPSIRDKHQNNYVLCSQNTTKNDATISNNDDIQYCETQKIINITTIPTTNHHSQRISSKPSSTLTSNTPTILPPVGK